MLNTTNECKLELGGEYKAYIGDGGKMEEVRDELYEVSDIIYLTPTSVQVILKNKKRNNSSIALNNPEITENSIISKYCTFISNLY